jgi:Zn finger protein HypA/HybF involved in hydrogenase expression
MIYTLSEWALTRLGEKCFYCAADAIFHNLKEGRAYCKHCMSNTILEQWDADCPECGTPLRNWPTKDSLDVALTEHRVTHGL